MSRLYIYAGIAASAVMIAIGIGSIVIGMDGRDRVRDDLAQENIVGSPDMGDIAGERVDTGEKAEEFADYMREHALADTGGETYAEMGRFLDEDGNATHEEEAAATDPETGEPVLNPARNIWVTYTGLSTALRTAYFAESVATFAIAMGVALLLAGIGFLVLVLRLPWRRDTDGTTPSA